MKAVGLALLGVAIAAGLAWLGGVAPFGRAEAATFHVDFDHGRDDGNGVTQATAWKHAPGDPAATGVPARTALRSGDVVTFAANVRYRGTIVVTASGSAGAPITFDGAGADGASIIDGSDPVAQVTPCRSAEECGGAEAWRRLVRIESAVPLTEDSALFTDKGEMRPAQGPDPKDDFYRDEIENMLEVDGGEMSQGRVALPHAIAAGLASGSGRLALWVKPNRVVYRPIVSMEGDTARFDPTGLQFYTDRPARAAARDHASLIDRPGEFLALPGGRTIVAMLPPGAGAVTVASGRGGFTVHGGSHLVFRNLGFENMADGGKLTGGLAILADKGSSNLVVENNRFHDFDMPQGQGPIIMREVSFVRIAGNSIDTIALGSGMRLSGAHLTVENNTIRRLGRTGIMLIKVDDATVQRNVITDVLGVHGNGLSAYLDNQNIRFVANTVTDAKQPATFKGAGQQATRDTNILFANNLFVATPDALGSLISWGDWTRGVIIRNNVLLGGKAGLRLSSKDVGVTISDNISSGLLVAGGQPADWKVVGNKWTALSFTQKKDGSKVSDDVSPGAMAELGRGRAVAQICAVVTRHSLPLAADSGDTARAVGAQLSCP